MKQVDPKTILDDAPGYFLICVDDLEMVVFTANDRKLYSRLFHLSGVEVFLLEGAEVEAYANFRVKKGERPPKDRTTPLFGALPTVRKELSCKI